MEAVVPHRVAFLEYCFPKQGQDYKLSAAPLYPNMGQVPPPRDLRSVLSCRCSMLYNGLKCMLRSVIVWER